MGVNDLDIKKAVCLNRIQSYKSMIADAELTIRVADELYKRFGDEKDLKAKEAEEAKLTRYQCMLEVAEAAYAELEEGNDQ